MNPAFHAILSAFSVEKVDYLIVGAYALAVHGHPRATRGIDLWIRISPENAVRTLNALARFGALLTEVEEEDLLTPGNVLKIGDEPQCIDIHTDLDGIDFADARQHRMDVDVDGLCVPIIGRSHLVRNKVATGRPQDLADLVWLEARNS